MKFSLCLSVAPTIKIYQETSTNKLLDKAMQIALSQSLDKHLPLTDGTAHVILEVLPFAYPFI